jgi:predicted methyltransferase
MKPRGVAVVAVVVLVPIVLVATQALATLDQLTIVERERDTWQRPENVLRHLDLRLGQTVVDFGSGAGYFALKIAPRLAPDGRVLAVDLRRQSLAFLWIRARRGGHDNLSVIRSETRAEAAARHELTVLTRRRGRIRGIRSTKGAKTPLMVLIVATGVDWAEGV